MTFKSKYFNTFAFKINIQMTFRLTILSIALFLFSCKNTDKVDIQSDNDIASFESTYRTNPTPENFNLLLQKLGSKIIAETDKEKKEALIIKSIDLCEETKNTAYINTFAIELIKTNPKSDLSKSYLLDIAKGMNEIGKTDVSSILLKGYADMFPDDARSKSIKDSLPNTYSDLHNFIKKSASKVFEKTDMNGVNKENSEKYVDLCESYALVYPQDTMSANYLFKAAEISRAMQSFAKTISLYDWISMHHPDNKNAPMALFLKGFLIENELKKPEEAKEIYQKFLAKYPNHAMSKDVSFLISNIGKSDKEIMEQIDKNPKSQVK